MFQIHFPAWSRATDRPSLDPPQAYEAIAKEEGTPTTHADLFEALVSRDPTFVARAIKNCGRELFETIGPPLLVQIACSLDGRREWLPVIYRLVLPHLELSSTQTILGIVRLEKGSPRRATDAVWAAALLIDMYDSVVLLRVRCEREVSSLAAVRRRKTWSSSLFREAAAVGFDAFQRACSYFGADAKTHIFSDPAILVAAVRGGSRCMCKAAIAQADAAAREKIRLHDHAFIYASKSPESSECVLHLLKSGYFLATLQQATLCLMRVRSHHFADWARWTLSTYSHAEVLEDAKDYVRDQREALFELPADVDSRIKRLRPVSVLLQKLREHLLLRGIGWYWFGIYEEAFCAPRGKGRKRDLEHFKADEAPNRPAGA